MTPAPNSPIPPNPPQIAAQATEMLDLMMRLADLLAHETDLLADGRVRDIEPLQREKLRLSLLYQKAIKEVRASGAKIVALPAPLRAQLFAAARRLAEEVTENERALRIGRAATRRLLDAIVESVQERLKPLSRYNARLAPARNAPVLALAVDRRM
jgi:hypothetical protein